MRLFFLDYRVDLLYKMSLAQLFTLFGVYLSKCLSAYSRTRLENER